MLYNLNAVIANTNGRLASIVDNGVVLLLTDGVSWIVESSGISAGLREVIVNASGKFVAVGMSGTILISDDGTM